MMPSRPQRHLRPFCLLAPALPRLLLPLLWCSWCWCFILLCVPSSRCILLLISSLSHCTCLLSLFSHVQLSATLWTAAHQAPLPMEFSRQECWSGLPCPESSRPRDQICISCIAGRSITSELPGKPLCPTVALEMHSPYNFIVLVILVFIFPGSV